MRHGFGDAVIGAGCARSDRGQPSRHPGGTRERQDPVPAPAAAGRPAAPLRGKVRIAFVGCGAATRELHLPVLTGHEGVTVTALVDRDLTRARELAAAYPGPAVIDDQLEVNYRESLWEAGGHD